MAIPNARLLNKINYKYTMIVGLVILSFGCLLFIPATILNIYEMFLVALFVLASGVVLLQITANPLITLLGPTKTSSARLSLAQGFNSVGTVLAPIVLGIIITPTNLLSLYLYLALSVILLALFFTRLDFRGFYDKNDSEENNTNKNPHIISNKKLIALSTSAIFLYVGAEVSIGSLMINYLQLPDIMHLTFDQAASYLSVYWGCAMVGRFLGFFVLKKTPASLLLMIYALINSFLLIGVTLFTGKPAMIALLSIGLFNSIMFPAIFSITLGQLPSLNLKNKMSSYLIMAIVGGAVVPLIHGILADRIGLQNSFFCLIFCYLYIIFFSYMIMKTPNPLTNKKELLQ